MVHFDRLGREVQRQKGKNLVVTAGKNLVANIMLPAGATKPSHMALGTGATVVAESNTALVAEVLRAAFSPAPTVNGNELTYAATITNPGPSTPAVNEAGIFNAGAAGTMLSRWLTQQFTMGVSESVTVTWILTFG